MQQWHNIRQSEDVKRSITYRQITVAIGILVAVIIVMTLWMGLPGSEISGSHAHPTYDLVFSAKTFVLNMSTRLFEAATSEQWLEDFGF